MRPGAYAAQMQRAVERISASAERLGKSRRLPKESTDIASIRHRDPAITRLRQMQAVADLLEELERPQRQRQQAQKSTSAAEASE